MTAPKEAVEAVQAALGCRRSTAHGEAGRAREPWCVRHHYEPWTERGCPVAMAAADAAAPHIAAQALREAADGWGRNSPVVRWLNERADRITAQS